MSVKTIKQIRAEMGDKLTSAKAIFEKGDDATPEELAQAETWTQEAQEGVKSLERLGGLEAMKTINTIENSIAVLAEQRNGRPQLGPIRGGDGATLRGAGDVAPAFKSFGEQFTSDESFGNWLKAVAPNGNMPKQQFTSPTIQVGSVIKALVRAGADASGGSLTWSDQRRDIVVPYLFRPFTVRDVITVIPTTSATVEYARVASVTNAAAPVAEATSTSTGTKPESAMVFEAVTDTIKTIAHWIPATRQILSDAPQMRGIIDSFLRDGLLEELEDQIVAGDGTGDNFTGILNTTGTTAQAWDTDLLTTTRRGRTKVRTTGRAIPNAYLMHPNDWEDVDLLQDAEQRYYFGGPMVMGTPRLWGLPVVETEAMTEGTATVGDHRVCVLWDREQTNISVSNSHENYFIKNLVAILAEMRAGFGILRPAAIVEIDLTA